MTKAHSVPSAGARQREQPCPAGHASHALTSPVQLDTAIIGLGGPVHSSRTYISLEPHWVPVGGRRSDQLSESWHVWKEPHCVARAAFEPVPCACRA